MASKDAKDVAMSVNSEDVAKESSITVASNITPRTSPWPQSITNDIRTASNLTEHNAMASNLT